MAHLHAPATPPEHHHRVDDSLVEYTCPMHPEVRQRGPGSCPICGMALEPVTVTLDEAPTEELTDMTRRFRVSLWFTLPILAFMVAELVPALEPFCMLMS